jgi:hypothetical protein
MFVTIFDRKGYLQEFCTFIIGFLLNLWIGQYLHYLIFLCWPGFEVYFILVNTDFANDSQTGPPTIFRLFFFLCWIRLSGLFPFRINSEIMNPAVCRAPWTRIRQSRGHHLSQDNTNTGEKQADIHAVQWNSNPRSH